MMKDWIAGQASRTNLSPPRPAWTSCVIALSILVSSPWARADVLDGIVFGVKCLGEADRQACEERSKREADEMRERMRQERPTTPRQQPRLATGEDAPSAGETVRRNWMQSVVCQPFVKRSGRDVDTLYARAVTRYGFITPRQAKALPGFGEGILYAAGYSHEVTPGALHRLEQVVHSADVANGKRQYKLILDLARDGSGTRVTAQYCVTTDDPAGWQDLPPQILRSLNNTF